VTGSTEFLEFDDLVELVRRLLGDSPPIRDVGLLESAVARPRATAFSEDAYRDIWTKAAALLESLVKNHALVDGNKRLAWLATAVFLEINGVSVTAASNDEVFELVNRAAAEHDTIEELAARLRGLVE
jgi:death-on-curing protein